MIATHISALQIVFYRRASTPCLLYPYINVFWSLVWFPPLTNAYLRLLWQLHISLSAFIVCLLYLLVFGCYGDRMRRSDSCYDISWFLASLIFVDMIAIYFFTPSKTSFLLIYLILEYSVPVTSICASPEPVPVTPKTILSLEDLKGKWIVNCPRKSLRVWPHLARPEAFHMS